MISHLAQVSARKREELLAFYQLTSRGQAFRFFVMMGPSAASGVLLCI